MSGCHPRIAVVALICVLATACGSHHGTSEAALRTGLVAWWRFDEGSGRTAADASGHGNTATIHGGHWGEGLTGSALSMDGGNDGIVTVSPSASLRGVRWQLTVSAWAYRSAIHNVALISHGYPEFFFGFHRARFKWQLHTAWGRGAACYADPRYEAGLGRWIHVAATYTGLKIHLYADGEEICSRWLFGPVTSRDIPWTVSGYLDDGRVIDEMSGRIDDVRIYDRALDAAQIRALYRQGRAQRTTPGDPTSVASP